MQFNKAIMALLIIVVAMLAGVVNITPDHSIAAPISNLLVAMQPQQIAIIDGGQELKVFSNANTVGELLTEQKIHLSSQDIVIPPTFQKLDGLVKISVIRVENDRYTEMVEVPAGELRIPDDQLYIGQSVEVSAGEIGSENRQIEVITADGQTVAERVVTVLQTEAPQAKIIAFGTCNYIEVAGERHIISKMIDTEATAYTAGFESTGKTPGHPEYGITASGLQVKEGHIAVDPRVIPLHSKVYIEGFDEIGEEYAGFYIATDTGGAIKGNKIDIYIEQFPEAYSFGRRPMRVYLIEPQ